MTFQEAIQQVLADKIVYRKMYSFTGEESNSGPWSSWVRIRKEPDSFGTPDILVYIETNTFDDESGKWVLEWGEDNLSKDDLLAEDWLLFEASDGTT